MEFSIEDRLKRLKSRRMDYSNTSLASRGFVEDFEQRTNNQATRYALGAMQEVDRRSTEISYEEAARVESALNERLPRRNLSPTFRLQGSVAMNTHIKGVSDVDILEILGGTITIAPAGSRAHYYTDASRPEPIADQVLQMRGITEDELSSHFWGATVDRSNAKSIQLSDGSFRRKVDVVPSHWHDSEIYQDKQEEIYRGVGVVNKNTKERFMNYPFLFRHFINQKGFATNDGSKMAIRLLKNLSADSAQELEISSYDIAGIVFHCPTPSITREIARDLSVLSGISGYLSALALDRTTAESLLSPDGTRKVLDQPGKWRAFQTLARNTSQLAREVERELSGPSLIFEKSYEDVLRHLSDSKISPAPSY